jgi:NAD-dependent DNA ligase
LIQIPKNCPSCGEPLEMTETELFCRNTEDCPAQNTKRLENFTKVMKIKGLGEKSIEKLFEHGVTSIPQLYEITLDELTEILGTANGTKIFSELTKSKTQKLELFIQGLGIKSIALSSSKIIANKITTLDMLKSRELLTDSFVKELGQVKHNNLVNFLNSELCDDVLALTLDLQSPVNLTSTTAIKGCVCITGKLDDFPNRKAAEEYLLQLGWESKASVTGTVTHLVCEDASKKSSSSYKKALEKGIPIVTIKQLTS